MGSFLISVVQVVLSYGVLLGLLWAFADATRFSKGQFKATKRMGRVAWLCALGLAIALTFWLGGFRFADPMGARSLTWLATVVLLIVYFYDTRPRLLRVRQSGA